MINRLFIEKTKASGIHLAISILIFIGILYLILVEWYPGPFFEVDGGWQGMRLMAAVDLVLGPSMTLIIYNHTKSRREIVMDLSVIAAIQLSALVWGGFQVYGQRPVALAMWDGVFYTVTEDYYQQQGFQLADLNGYSDDKPLILLAYNDHTAKTLEEIRKFNEKLVPPYAQVHLYRPISDNLNMVMSDQLSDLQLKKIGINQQPGQHVFLALAKHGNLLLYLDDRGRLIKIIEKPAIDKPGNLPG